MANLIISPPTPTTREQVRQSSRSIIAETGRLDATGVALTYTSGHQHSALMGLLAGDVIENLIVDLTTLGTNVTIAKMGIYSSGGTLLRATADVDTTFRSNIGHHVVPLTSTYTIPTNGAYYVGLCLVFTSTAPQIHRCNGTAAGTWAAIAATGNAGLIQAVTQTGLSDLADPLTLAAGTNMPWFAVN